MSRFYPHPTHAEDQPLAHTILGVHVLYRGFQTGALLGPAVGAARHGIASLRSRAPPKPLLTTTLLRGAGVGGVVGMGVLGLALAGRMYGREEIEWRDRSWRLLENRGQVEVDDWSAVGAIAGGAAVGGRGLVGRLGGMGVGTLLGTGCYMIWRHGINGGRWD